MIETSKDLLFVILALCILWLTVFLSWLLYYVIVIIRDAEALIRKLKEAAQKIEQLTHTAQEKLNKSAATFSLVATALKEVLAYLMEQHRKSGEKKGRAKRKKSE